MVSGAARTRSSPTTPACMRVVTPEGEILRLPAAEAIRMIREGRATPVVQRWSDSRETRTKEA